MKRLLINCLGNICRSPMGQGALQQWIGRENAQHRYVVESAGVSGWHQGEPPDQRAIACAKRHGVDIAQQRARQVTRADFNDYHWLLCADATNLDALQRLAPAGLAHKAVLWLPWAGVGPPIEIPDPYTGSEQTFEEVWQRIDVAAGATMRRLLA